MDDSTVFLHWAMNSFDQIPTQQIPAVYADGRNPFPSLHVPPRNGSHGGLQDQQQQDQKTNSRSSCDTGSNSAMDYDGRSPNSIPVQSPKSMSWNFGTATMQPSEETRAPASHDAEAMYGNAPRKGGAKMTNAGGGASPYAQDHIIAERKRREKINQRFIELSTVIPGLKKMDKATILGDAVSYVKELQEKVKVLEDQHTKNIESVVLVKKSCSPSPDDDVGAPSSNPSSKNLQSTKALPEIEARVSDNNILVRIHCENMKGLLVKILSEIEQLHLTIAHTNVMPFPACTVIITITAKMEEGFNMTVEDVVRNLDSALHQLM